MEIVATKILAKTLFLDTVSIRLVITCSGISLLVDDRLMQLGIFTAATHLTTDRSNRLHYDDVVVNAHSEDQTNEADDLQVVEALPSDEQRDGPNHHCSDRVEHHSGRRGDLLSNGNAGEIEEGNRDDRTGNWDHQQMVVLDHVKSVDRVFHDSPRVFGEVFGHANEIHRNEEQRQDEETEESLPANSLQRWDVQTGHESLLEHHLARGDNLRENDQRVSDQDIGSINIRAAASKHVTQADASQADDDESNASPLTKLKAPLQEYHRLKNISINLN